MIKILKKISAGVLLSLGFMFLLVSVSELPKEKRDRDTIMGGLMLGVPLFAGGGWIVWEMNRQHQRQLEAQKQQETDRLNTIFYQLLTVEEGRIDALQMAIKAQISPAEARAFLDGKAKEFETTFEIGDRGEVFYVFEV